MNRLESYLNKNLRIIEFSRNRSFFPESLLEADNFLSIVKKNKVEGKQSSEIYLSEKKFLNTISKNSTEIIVLNSCGWRELKSLQKTIEAKLFFERLTLFSTLPIIYFLTKEIISRRARFYGFFHFKRGFKRSIYVGVKRLRKQRKNARHYLSPLVSIKDFFLELNKNNISYCVLRWFEDLPDIDENEDIDILVEDDDLSKMHSIVDKKPGILPLDIYSKTGIPGSDFKNLPYYTYILAQRVLENTVLHKNVYKVPTHEDYFYLLAYHAVFHKGENSGLPSIRFDVNSNNKPEHDYLFHLKKILSQTTLGVDNFTLEGLHEFLESKGYVPPLDTQYKLSLYNKYLKVSLEKYHSQSDLLKKFEGLVCFVAREKIVESGLIEELQKFIQKQGFTIIHTTKLEGIYKQRFTQGVRGGNWHKGPWPSSAGLPSVLLVAFDVYPIEPNDADQKKHPGITNSRIQDKNEIRNLLNKKFPNKEDWCNGVHSSDNEIQAVEYLTLAGLNEDEIYEETIKYRDKFKSKYPVIKVLSRFSRRAKVELISYNGKKAVLKTFKPKCNLFLSYELEAYNAFSDIKEVPRLLETGDNYFITEYINGGRPFKGKINIRTLKKCLELLRKIYDLGYSLLDFNPSNFLIDKDGGLHLIDFEFLYKYERKPVFLNCYDLVGVPETFDQLHKPISKIPKGKKLFDVNWTGYTGVHYEELKNLNKLSVYIKSHYRFNARRFKKLTSLFWKSGKKGIRLIYRSLP